MINEVRTSAGMAIVNKQTQCLVTRQLTVLNCTHIFQNVKWWAIGFAWDNISVEIEQQTYTMRQSWRAQIGIHFNTLSLYISAFADWWHACYVTKPQSPRTILVVLVFENGPCFLLFGHKKTQQQPLKQVHHMLEGSTVRHHSF